MLAEPKVFNWNENDLVYVFSFIPSVFFASKCYMLGFVLCRNRAVCQTRIPHSLGVCRLELRRDFTEGPNGVNCTSPKESCTQEKARGGGRSCQGCSRGSAEVSILGSLGRAGRDWGVEQAEILSLICVGEVFHLNLSLIGSQ